MTGNAHVGQVQHRIAAQVGRRVAGQLVVVAVGIQRFRRFSVLQIEKLQLRANIINVAHRRQPFQVPLQNLPGVAGERFAARRADVAKHTCHRVASGSPRQQGKRRRVGERPHVAFLFPRVAFDCRSIEANPQFKGIFQIVNRYGKSFQMSQYIGKPQAYEFDIEVAGAAQNILAFCGVIIGHQVTSPGYGVGEGPRISISQRFTPVGSDGHWAAGRP